MIGNRWFCQPDDERESWCFMVLELKQEDNGFLAGWEISYGNPKRTVRTLENAGSNEVEILRELVKEINYCRRKQIPVITLRDDIIPKIRTRILYSTLEEASFQGLENISIESLLRENFVGADLRNRQSVKGLCEELKIETANRSETELLREAFLRIGPLVPRDSLHR